MFPQQLSVSGGGDTETPPSYSGLFVAERTGNASHSQAAPPLARNSSLINSSLTLGNYYQSANASQRSEGQARRPPTEGSAAAPRRAPRRRMHSGARRPPDRGSGAPRWPRPCGARPLRGPRPGSPSPRAVPGRAGPGCAVPCRRPAPPPAHGAAGVVGGPGGWWSCWCLCRLDPFSSGHCQNQTAKSPRILEGWWLSWHLCWCSLHCYRILSKCCCIFYHL